jgi:hypothetical protein
MKTCPACGALHPDFSRFCTRCGTSLGGSLTGRHREEMNLPALYVMVALILLALLMPPWETPAGQSPEFLGFHFILTPPETPAGEKGIVSRLLLTIELVTIAVGGIYFSWLFRKREFDD